MSTATVIYDDTVPVPERVRALTGIDRFGRLLRRRVRSEDAAAAVAAAAGIADFVRVRGPSDARLLIERAADLPEGHVYVALPSSIVLDPEEGALLLAKLVLSPTAARVGNGTSGPLARPILRLHAHDASAYLHALRDGRATAWAEESGVRFLEIDRAEAALDLEDAPSFASFLTGAFDTRAFNRMSGDADTVVKVSSDKDKMRREAAFCRLLPDRLRAMFVQPWAFEDRGDCAAYSMERMNVPDMALQWIHDALDDREFDEFLRRVFRWFELRPSRRCPQGESDTAADRCYGIKIDERAAQFGRLPASSAIASYLACGTESGSLGAMIERWKGLRSRMRRAAPFEPAVSHGDPCFSNILYDKRIGMLRFIDPRGADSEEELYMDPYYDLAKLSHSILGGYDYLNNGLCAIEVGQDLRLRLLPDAPDQSAKKESFLRLVRSKGFDPDWMRLCEASLFLSMIPLHAEAPRKVLAFLLNAEGILAGLEAKHGR